ncbi:MAG: hypothetical protein AMJ81_05740 [Phycisphaerae bacterium SM23_33]|nr:MAG: hypothetical protein AMJ81_05740 [Phycisphaerae bacterium SM23_33]
MKGKFSILAAGLLLMGAASAASAPSAEVLLEKGVFLEEMKGDRDGAMKIYQRIVDQAQAGRRCVAEALYRLGMGHLSKGDKEKAAGAFNRLVRQYAEQKKFADRAQAELAKLAPAAAPDVVAFGPPVERVINDIDEAGGDQMIDFETGKLFSLPADFAGWTRGRRDEWMGGEGRDALVDHAADGCVLGGYDFVAVSLGAARWEAIRPRDVASELPAGQPRVETITRGRATSYLIQRGTMLAFKTRDGGTGVLEVLAFTQDPKGVRIRYKMLHRPGSAPAARPAAAFGPVVERVLNSPDVTRENSFIDLDTGNLFTVPEGLNRKPEEMSGWMERNQIDFGVGDLSRHLGKINKVRFFGIGAVLLPTKNELWDTLTPSDVDAKQLGIQAKVAGPRMDHLQVERFTGQQPYTCIFKTREGGAGLLQIIGFNAKGSGISIRYKLLRQPLQADLLPLNQAAERTVYDTKAGKSCVIDFDTGNLFTPPSALALASHTRMPSAWIWADRDWLRDTGIDAQAEVEQSGRRRRLACRDMVVIPTAEGRWSTLTAQELRKELAGKELWPRTSMTAEKELPATFLFKTREGSMGILQILQVNWRKPPQNLKIRYRLLDRRAPAAYLPLGKPVERTVYGEGSKDLGIDLDTGKLFTSTARVQDMDTKREFRDWLARHGFDLLADTSAEAPGLYGGDMIVIPMATARWEKVTLDDIRSDIAGRKPTSPVVMGAKGELPRTYAFKTREGSVGVLQILEIGEKPLRHIKIRYKLLACRAAPLPAPGGASTKGASTQPAPGGAGHRRPAPSEID